MKIRESGMPNEEGWNRFFSPPKILAKMGLDKSIIDVADFGCGYGTFTIPAAKMISGKIFALDIDSVMVEATRKKAKENKLDNVEVILRDFISEGSGLRDSSVDFVMLFNILHLDKPSGLLKEAYRILGVGGRIGIIHWNYDASTPRGPPLEIRPRPEECRLWAELVGFIFEKQLDLKPYHYGVVMRK
jgi:ubiquinone/menaquinone biosynthesis C-methylase UbiE